MNEYVRLFLFGMLPIGLMFLAERSFILVLGRNKNLQKWVRSKFWLHPNFISRCRYPMGVVSVLLYYYGFQNTAIIWFGFWMITDLTDGSIARHCNLQSEEGEVIDPWSDKLLIFPPLLYFGFKGDFGNAGLYLLFVFLAFDLIGQFSRYFIMIKAANLFGKAKTFLAVVTLLIIILQDIYLKETVHFGSNPWSIPETLLPGVVFLSFCSMFFKIIPNYWYANILSILNFLCGIGGILLIFNGFPIGYAFALVFLGQFLDLFDGRAADRWGSTPRGELLDDLADGTNFGGTIAFLVYAAFQNSITGLLLGILHFVCTTFRLVRFLSDKKKAGVSTGVSEFSGLPSPAAALIAGSAALLFSNFWIKGGIIVLTSVLMISKVPYIHFGRVILPSIPNMVKVLLLTIILVAVSLMIVFIKTPVSIVVLSAVFGISSSYLVLGYPWKKANKNN
ncbi:MAG: CDP-diacylglycerol--serine O-phosphatidyltransferase [bacterium]|jgi:CDP-diacylglycerol--serine O-phosphatidyltransferase